MFDKSHRVINLTGVHLTDTRTEAGDGQYYHISNLSDILDAGEVGPGDVAEAQLRLKVTAVVEVGKDSVRPPSWTGEFNHAATFDVKRAGLLPVQRLFGDVGDNVDEDGMTGFGLDGPLAELHSSRVPLGPVLPVRVGFDANHQPDGATRDPVGEPFVGGPKCGGVDIAVDATTSEQDKVAEKVGLENGERQSVIGLEHLRHGRVQMAHQRYGGAIGHDLVHEARVLLRPTSLLGAQVLGEAPRSRGVLPGLPDVTGELGLDVVGKLIFQVLLQRRCTGAGQGLLFGSS